MVTVTVDVRDVLDAVTPLRNTGYLLVRPWALELADPVVSRNGVQVTVPVSGVTSFVTDATPAGNALQITPLSLGESDLVWTVQVPDVGSIDLGTLIRDHSVDPASLEPISAVPTVREELDNLDTRVTDLEDAGPGGGGGAVASVNTQTGAVVLDQDDIPDGTTAKQYTATDKAKLAGLGTASTHPATDFATAAQGAKADSAVQPAGLTGYAPLASPTFTGTPAVPTPTPGDNSTKPASTAYVVAGIAAAIANLIATAPGTLDTLKELADSLGDDPNFAATITTALAGKVPTSRTVNGHALSADVAVTKGDVGLGSVDNTSDATKPVSTAQQTALDAKAPLASPTFTGIPATPTAAVGTNSPQVASTAFVKAAIDALVAGAPGALDTLKEIADQLAGDESAVAALTTVVAGKVPATRTVAGHALSADVVLAKADVGLGNVDNTADAAKPVSTAQQTALDGKLATAAFLNGLTGVWIGTQAQYAALGSYTSTVLYAITP